MKSWYSDEAKKIEILMRWFLCICCNNDNGIFLRKVGLKSSVTFHIFFVRLNTNYRTQFTYLTCNLISHITSSFSKIILHLDHYLFLSTEEIWRIKLGSYHEAIFVFVFRVQRLKFALAVGKCWGFCRGIYMFYSICLGKKNAKAIEFWGILKITFPRIKK